ncbi:hypothetical protein [Bosea sp. (in: a-proteobacteria)]|uniref:hypothetical protein n=1 Tax=Bosea sp. (in: a-proteobacteria) TaxID=1871050 RepID=UPI002FC5B7D4
MNPSSGAYTVAMPWYEREDFYRLLELSADRKDMTADYDVWQSKATAVAREYLARGRALQIITIRPDEFLEWLDAQGLPNSSPNRLRYVEMRASAAAAVVADIATAANAVAAVASLRRDAASVDQRIPLDHHQKDGTPAR